MINRSKLKEIKEQYIIALEKVRTFSVQNPDNPPLKIPAEETIVQILNIISEIEILIAMIELDRGEILQ